MISIQPLDKGVLDGSTVRVVLGIASGWTCSSARLGTLSMKLRDLKQSFMRLILRSAVLAV